MNTSITADSIPAPSLTTLLWRGFRKVCPRCGNTHLFKSFLRIPESCSSCQMDLGSIRADDFPPYLTMVIVGHIVVPLLLLTEKTLHPTITQQLMVWLPVTGVLTLWFLPRVKGAIIGLMIHLGLRGDETQ